MVKEKSRLYPCYKEGKIIKKGRENVDGRIAKRERVYQIKTSGKKIRYMG
jgi:hypothetical protein